MIPAIIIMTIALGWLLWETRGLMVRLPYGVVSIYNELMRHIIGAVVAYMVVEELKKIVGIPGKH